MVRCLSSKGFVPFRCCVLSHGLKNPFFFFLLSASFRFKSLLGAAWIFWIISPLQLPGFFSSKTRNKKGSRAWRHAYTFPGPPTGLLFFLYIFRKIVTQKDIQEKDAKLTPIFPSHRHGQKIFYTDIVIQTPLKLDRRSASHLIFASEG